MSLPMSRTGLARFDRRALANEAMQASIAARLKAGLDLFSPICIYDLCKAEGVPVRFNAINMEGMYQRGSPSRIHLSSRRPLARRAYNCAHELGHHLFGHGSSIDELREEAKANRWEDPKEFLADTFAGFLLMPTLGLRRAFAGRGWKAETADPTQIYQVACEFGVGYTTLVTHLCYGVGMIARDRATALLKATPKAIRAQILGEPMPAPLIVADMHWASPTLDAEVGMQLLLPPDTAAASDVITPVRDLRHGRLFQATRSGIGRVARPGTPWAVFARVMRKEYIGLAEYRHLEDDADE